MGRDEKMSTGSNTQVDFNHWLMRFLALIIDSIPVSIIAVLITLLAIAPFFSHTYGAYWYSVTYVEWYVWPLLFPFIYGILALLYFIIMEVMMGATLGKKVLGMQVQMTNGSKVTFDKSFIRNISKLFSYILILDWLIGVFTPGHDPHQKYTDRMAGTTVVSVKPGFASGAAPPPPPPPPS